MRPPCKACPDRWADETGNCHVLCAKYQLFLAHNRMIHQEKRREAVVHEYMIVQKAKNDKKRRKKKGETK